MTIWFVHHGGGNPYRRHDRNRVEQIVPRFAIFFVAAIIVLTLLAKRFAPQMTESVLSNFHRASTSDTQTHDSHPMPQRYPDRG